MINRFLHNVEISLMNEENKEVLESPILLSQVISTIKGLELSKAPGTDGLTTEFYKKYAELLAPRLLEVFELCFQQVRLPPSWSESKIILIPKTGKDLTLPQPH